jgi:hypothetical protein
VYRIATGKPVNTSRLWNAAETRHLQVLLPPAG